MPKTFRLSKKLQEFKHRSNFELQEHLMNIANMQKRIAAQGDKSVREKNKFDPVAHPSLFFRRDG